VPDEPAKGHGAFATSLFGDYGWSNRFIIALFQAVTKSRVNTS
jgi:hypothetical protein